MMKQQQWGEFISEQLEHLSNLEYQRRIWIQGKGPEVSSFNEVLNLFFDHFDGFLELPKISSNKSLCSALNEVYFALKAADDVMNDQKISEDFLESPMWQSVMKLAKQAKEKLDKERLQWDEHVLN